MENCRSPSQRLHTSVTLKWHNGHTSDPSHVAGTEAEHSTLHAPQHHWEKTQDSDEHTCHAFQWGSDPGPTRARAAASESVGRRTVTAAPSAAIPPDSLLQKQRFLCELQAAPTVHSAGAGALANNAQALVDSTPMPTLKQFPHLAKARVWVTVPSRPESRAWDAASPATAFCYDLRGPSQQELGNNGSSTGPWAQAWGCSGGVASRVAADPLIRIHHSGLIGSPDRVAVGIPRSSVDAGPDLDHKSSLSPLSWSCHGSVGPRGVTANGLRRTLHAQPGVPGVCGLGLFWGRRDRPESVVGALSCCGPNEDAQRAVATSNRCAASPCSSDFSSESHTGTRGCDGGYSDGPRDERPSTHSTLAAPGYLGSRCPDGGGVNGGPNLTDARGHSCALGAARLVHAALGVTQPLCWTSDPGLCGGQGSRTARRHPSRYTRLLPPQACRSLQPKGKVGVVAPVDAHTRLQLRGLLLAAVGDGRVQRGRQKPLACLDSLAEHLCSLFQVTFNRKNASVRGQSELRPAEVTSWMSQSCWNGGLPSC